MRIVSPFRVSALIIIIIVLSTQIMQALTIPSYGAWGIFHYYLGAKYIKELGYFDLYSCALQTKNPKWQAAHFVRNLHDYKIISVRQLPGCPRNNFTTARWRAFTTDTNFILARASPDYWSQVITDKGFNPPPSWTAVAGAIANSVPLNNFTYLVLFNLDLLFICLAALLVMYDTGSNTGLITLLLSLLYFGTLGILGNNFLQYAWYPLLVAALILWHKKKPIFSGITLGVSTGLQVFPIFFAFPVFCLFIASLLRRQKVQLKLSSRFISSLITALALCIITGSIYGGTITVWQQWYNKIAIHKNYLPGEIFNIGFINLAGIITSSNRANSNTYIQDYPHALSQNQTIKQNLYSIYLIIAFCLLLVIFAICRSKQNQPLIYGIFLLYLILTLSPYYYLILALIPYMFWRNSLHVRRFALYGTFLLFLLHIFLFGESYVSFIYLPQLISKLLIFLFFIILIILLVLEKEDKLAEA